MVTPTGVSMSLKPCIEDGFTLWEVLLSVAISSMIVALACGLAVNLSNAAGQVALLGEAHAMQLSAERVVTEDIHAATSASVSGGILYVTEAGGTQYRYDVNSKSQFVRYQSTGGTTVIAAGVSNLVASVSNQTVRMEIHLQNGQIEVLTVVDIQGMAPNVSVTNTTP